MRLIRKNRTQNISETTTPKDRGWRVLVVDDESGILTMTRLVLGEFLFDGRGVSLTTASSAKEAMEVLQSSDAFAVALIDVVMETDDAGLRLVDFIRNKLNDTQIRLIIRTGQPGVAPEWMVIENYDIDDYKDKTELTSQKLYTTIRTALKSYRDMSLITNTRTGLEQILTITPSLFMHDNSVNGDFYNYLLQEMGKLLAQLHGGKRAEDQESGFFALFDDEESIKATLGRFSHHPGSDELQEMNHGFAEHLRQEQPVFTLNDNRIFLAINRQGKLWGYIYLESIFAISRDSQHLLRMMSNLASAALENILLHVNLDEANLEAYQKSRIFGTLSHDIKSPMVNMLGLVQLLQDTSLNELQREYISSIQQTGKGIETVLNNLLDLTQIGTGQFELSLLPFNIFTTTEEVVQLFRDESLENQISITISGSGAENLDVQGDPQRFHQILLHLLGDAMRTLSNREVTIDIESLASIEGQVEVAVKVGYCVEKPLTNSKTPSIGYSISQELISQMGGRLGIEVNEERGLVIWFSLPFKSASAQLEVGLESETSQLIHLDQIIDSALFKGNAINRNIFRHMQQTMGEDFVELLEIYQQSAASILDALVDNARLGDRAEVRRNSHSLRSSSANIGAMLLSEMARVLEQETSQNLPVALEEKIANLRLSYQQVQQEIVQLTKISPAEKV